MVAREVSPSSCGLVSMAPYYSPTALHRHWLGLVARSCCAGDYEGTLTNMHDFMIAVATISVWCVVASGMLADYSIS